MKNTTIQQSFLWAIGEYDPGGSALIWCSAICHLNYFENYYTVPATVVCFTKHCLFAYAESWTGEVAGYDLYVYTDSITQYYNSRGEYVTSSSLYYDPNVWTGQGWIWDNKVGTNSVSVSGYSARGTGRATFYCPDAFTLFTPNTRILSCSLTCP